MSLFDRARPKPLAERMRPKRLAEIVGQAHLLGPGGTLRRALVAKRLPSMLLWGPPGTGKTTLANAVAAETGHPLMAFSAVLGGLPQLRKLIAEGEERSRLGRTSLLFVDEIHRFNKAQQDALLPHVELGTVVLIGATTENPAFAVNRALLSRTRVFRLQALGDDDVLELLHRALGEDASLANLAITDDGMRELARLAHGDARRALTVLESLSGEGRPLEVEEVRRAFEAAPVAMDEGDRHALMSAFIKSMRGSDPDASVYYLMRLVEGGEDPRIIGRRLIVFASEDVGNADPRALSLAIAADAAVARIGLPEGNHALSQCTLYMAVAPKSDASYRAFVAAREDVVQHGPLPVPMKLRTGHAPGHGEGYRNPHREGGFAEGEVYLPERLAGRVYYTPVTYGFEGRIRDAVWRRRGERGEDGERTHAERSGSADKASDP
ncbi:MAG: replication-associated recombination protein A [Myxococcota bacterium]